MTSSVGPAAVHVRADELLAAGRRVVLATVVGVGGSAPLEPGATMLIDDAGDIEGSVTGGCVESELVGRAQTVLAGGPAEVRSYGISDELAGEVGLMCGGSVQILLREVRGGAQEALACVSAAVRGGQPVVLATVADGPSAGAAVAFTAGAPRGDLGDESAGLLEAVARDAAALADGGVTVLRHFGRDGTVAAAERTVALQAFGPRPRMVVVGAIDHALALAGLAPHVGFDVTVCEPRPAFASPQRFAPAELVLAWPDVYLAEQRLGPRDAVIVLSHDAKIDEPALVAALASGAGYVGAMGSRRTTADRAQRLKARGVAEDDIARVASPAGLDIGARTPGEVALAILAEVVARAAGRDGRPLATTEGPIRPRTELAPRVAK